MVTRHPNVSGTGWRTAVADHVRGRVGLVLKAVRMNSVHLPGSTTAWVLLPIVQAWLMSSEIPVSYRPGHVPVSAVLVHVGVHCCCCCCATGCLGPPNCLLAADTINQDVHLLKQLFARALSIAVRESYSAHMLVRIQINASWQCD